MYFQSVGKNKEYIVYCLQWVIQKARERKGFLLVCVCLFSPNSTLNLSKKKYCVQLSFACIHRRASRGEPQGYAEQGVELGIC